MIHERYNVIYSNRNIGRWTSKQRMPSDIRKRVTTDIIKKDIRIMNRCTDRVSFVKYLRTTYLSHIRNYTTLTTTLLSRTSVIEISIKKNINKKQK